MNKFLHFSVILSFCSLIPPSLSAAEEDKEVTGILINNVQIFNGIDEKLSKPTNVLIENNTIKSIGLEVTSEIAFTIDGKGKTLMPGLIESHGHVAFNSLPQAAVMFGKHEYAQLYSAKQLEAMLLRGVTTVRDMGGNTFSLKKAIDDGLYMGPRIYPSGAIISQTSGHADFRVPNEPHPKFGGATPILTTFGHSYVVDDEGDVRAAARENLRNGASQIKITNGGGYSSPADPIMTKQFTLEETKAAVDAANDWGTYVATHVYSTEGVNRAIDAGVKVIEHGQLADKKTLQRMAKEGVFLSTQPFTVCEEPQLDAFSNSKLAVVCKGTVEMYKLIKEVPNLKVTHGTDLFFVPQKDLDGQVKQMERLLEWFTPAQILKMTTGNTGELLKLSGLRDPYPGKIGIVEEGALADLLLVSGDPTQNLKSVTEQDNILLIVKDGKIYKNAL